MREIGREFRDLDGRAERAQAGGEERRLRARRSRREAVEVEEHAVDGLLVRAAAVQVGCDQEASDAADWAEQQPDPLPEDALKNVFAST